jgi:hypothetical protein
MLKNQNITMKILKNKIKLIKLMVFKMKNKMKNRKILIKQKVMPQVIISINTRLLIINLVLNQIVYGKINYFLFKVLR